MSKARAWVARLMLLSGEGRDGGPKHVRFLVVARSGHGPYIPCMPAILLARKLARGEVERRGATPCVDLIDLPEYLQALKGLDISIHADPPRAWKAGRS